MSRLSGFSPDCKVRDVFADPFNSLVILACQSDYRGTYKILDCMRIAYEPLMLEYQVDIMFNGHVHVSTEQY
jgi:hypothetical protein